MDLESNKLIISLLVLTIVISLFSTVVYFQLDTGSFKFTEPSAPVVQQSEGKVAIKIAEKPEPVLGEGNGKVKLSIGEA